MGTDLIISGQDSMPIRTLGGTRTTAAMDIVNKTIGLGLQKALGI